MLGLFEYFKILAVGLIMVLSFYFLFEIPVDFGGIAEVEALNATTSLEVGNAAPSVTNVKLNGGSIIKLIESSATTVQATATVSDGNAYHDIASITGKVYRSGVTGTEACTIDGNNCYQDAACATSVCSGNDCIVTCTFNVWFIAERTDFGTYSGEHWVAWIRVEDKQGTTSSATSSAQTIELETLTAMDITDAIDYSSLGPGGKIDPLSKLVMASTTGNEAIDVQIAGSNMCTDYPACVVNTTSIYAQHYATGTPVGYASTSDEGCYTASTTDALLEFVTVKPTATPTDQGQTIDWGTAVSSTQAIGTYTGVNTFTVQSDI